MRGLLFTEFLDFVEVDFSYEVVDQIIQDSALPHGGAYTSGGDYPPGEMATLLHHLSHRTAMSISALLHRYGRHFLGTLSKSFAYFFEGPVNAFTFLEQLETHIHAYLRRMQPDAKLPYFETRRLTQHSLEMIYRSEQLPADFTAGVIEATLDHYQEVAAVSRENVTPDGSSVRFLIEKRLS